MKSFFCLVLFVACVSICVGARSGDVHIDQVEQGLLPIAATQPGVSANIENRMRAYGVPGLSVAVVDRGKIAWAKGYGLADVASGRRVSTSTLFQAGSISKPVSAMAVLGLVQQGRVRLDEPVNEALRSWKIPENDFTRSRAVTIRMLLNHTAGLEHANAESYLPFAAGDKIPSILQVLRGEAPARGGAVAVTSRPGESFAYSGAGYEVLQQLIDDVAGQPFEQYARANVLMPLGMTDSTFAEPLPRRLQVRTASGYYAGGKPLPGQFRVSPELTVAGLWTSPTDIARYIVNVQRSRAGLVHEPLNEDMTREMLTPGLGSRGLGPAISGSGRYTRFGHDGFNEGFESSFVAYEQGGRGAVVMANSGFSFMLIKEVLESIGRVYR